MKSLKIFRSPMRLTLGIALLSATTLPLLALSPGAQSAPRRLEIWPGQRFLMLLPTTLGSDWNADPQLGQTLLPLTQRPLRDALANTRKFSISVPYRFDPLLRRAVVDKRLADSDVDALLSNPGVESAQPILGKLSFDQPAMLLETRLEELRVGGTPKNPTVQLQVSGRLYQAGGGAPIKNITVTSRSFGGSTPAERVSRAATQGFQELAQRLVEPPESFSLPAPPTPTPAPRPTATPGSPSSSAPRPNPNPSAPNGTNSGSTPTVGELPAIAPVAPSNVTTTPPSSISPQAGAPFVPQLPAAQPPLGIAVNDTPGVAR